MKIGNQMKPSPPLPWKIKMYLSAISALTDACFRSDGTVNRFLLLADLKAAPNPNSVHGVKSFDITIDSTRNVWFRIFIPTAVRDDVSVPVIVFFHGGGFIFFGADTRAYDFACRRLAKKVVSVVVSVSYRLAPEHRFPSQYDDGFDVLKFLDKNGAAVLPKNADLTRCFLAGDSAGGNIAHHMALRSASGKFQKIRIEGLIAIQPFFGGEERTESEIRLEGSPLVSIKSTDFMWKAFLPVGSNRDHEVVNVTGPNSIDISGMEYFPKTLVIIGGYDPLKDRQMRYYNWLKNSGKKVYLEEYPNSIHAFYIFSELPVSKELFERVSKFINRKA